MKSWMLKHPVVRGLIWLCSLYTWIYGFGHVVSVFGWKFHGVPEGTTWHHLGFGVSMLVAGLAGMVLSNRAERSEDDRRDPWGRRQAAQAIRERAASNYSETPPIRRLIQES